MKIEFERTLGNRKLNKQGELFPVQAVAWAPNSKRLAYCDDDRCIWIFGEDFEQLLHFPTKPVEKEFGKNSFMVTGIEFSPDSTKLAVGQSDEVVYVYRLPKDRDKTELAVVAKYNHPAPVTGITWMSLGNLVVGLHDGLVRTSSGSKHSETVHQTEHQVISVMGNAPGTILLSAHLDGTTYMYQVDKDTIKMTRKLFTTPKPASCLAFTGNFILIGGCDNIISVYDSSGKKLQEIVQDSTDDYEGQRLTAAVSAPNGRNVVFASFNRLRLFTYLPKKGVWIENSPLSVENLYVVPALAWKKDGTKLVASSLFGAVDIFDCALRKRVQQQKFEITFVTGDQVLLRDIQTNRRISFRTESGLTIDKLVVLNDLPLVVGVTSHHLILIGSEKDLTSEVPWKWKTDDQKKPMFHLDGRGCVVFYDECLFVIELGRNDILYSVTTPNFYARLFSLQISDSLKVFACLPTRRNLRVINVTGRTETVGNFKHEVDLDWVTLSNNCAVVVARDVRSTLLLFNTATKEKIVLCQRTAYVELIEGTDILIAEEKRQIRAWYNIGDGKDGMTEKTVAIEGRISEVVRTNGQTAITTKDNDKTNVYLLEDDIAQFETAMKKLQFERAYEFLRTASELPQKAADWKLLIAGSLDGHNFSLAERIFESLNDPRAKDVKDLIARIQQLNKEQGRSMDQILANYAIRATIERIKGNLTTAEEILVAQRDYKRAIVMYGTAEKFVRSIQLAQKYEPGLVTDLVAKYKQQLAGDSAKKAQLAEILAHMGQSGEAASLFLTNPLKPLEAYRLLLGYPDVLRTLEGKKLHEKLLPVLEQTGLHEMVGQLLELTGDVKGALKAYRLGHCFEHAIEYARKKSPEEVVPIEIECATYLEGIHKWQDAISHFIEANMNTKALDAAIRCQDFRKAAQILTVVDDDKVINEYGQRLALYFQDRDELLEAVEMYKKIGKPREAIKMYMARGKIEEAFKYAETIIKSDEIKELFRNEARLLVANKRYPDAERMFLQIGDVDSAIDMYNNLQQFQRVIALVQKHKEHALNDTYIQVAESYRKMGSLRQAELYLIKGQNYKEVVQMYVGEEKWPDAYRCALAHIKEMADDILYLWISQQDPKAGVEILRSLGVTKQYIKMAVRAGEFNTAFLVANENAPDQLSEIYLQRGIAMAEAGRHEEAERDYLAAGQPSQAVQMYIDADKFSEAIRLATIHFPSELPQIMMSNALSLASSGQFQAAEEQYIQLNRPDHAINMYKSQGMWDDALRIAREFRPSETQALEIEFNRASLTRGRTTKPGENLLQQAREKEETSDYQGAVQLYLNYISDTTTADSAQLTRVCARVRELALSFLGDADARVAVETVANKLLSLNKPALAATAFSEINNHSRALQVLMDTGEWDDARALVHKLQEPQYTRILDTRYKEFLRAQGKVEQLASVDAASAVEMYARNGEWEKSLKVCIEIRDLKLLSKYIYEYGVILLKSGEETKVMELFTTYGAPVTDDTIGIYRHLFCYFAAKSFPEINEGFRIWVSLRDLIFAVGENLVRNSAEVSVGITAEFEKYLNIAIFYASHFALISEETTKELGWMILLSLLRYSDVINPDKAFYDGGRAAQQLKWSGMADVLFNFYLDWRECILHQNIGLVDYTQFVGSDVPTNVTIPSQSSVSAEAYEEVKAWIMKAALDRSLKFELRKDERGVFEISLSGGRYPPCILTGYPVINNGVKLGTAGRYARKPDLNRFLQAIRSTRSEKLEEMRRFFVKWCGAATELNYAFI